MYNAVLQFINNITNTTAINFDIFALNITISNSVLASIITFTFLAILMSVFVGILTLLPCEMKKSFKRWLKRR